jgi:6-phosphogluconolactonase (cycloisomerase 2 family)
MIRVARGLVTIMMGAGVLGPVMNATAQTGQEAVFVMTNAADKNEVIVYQQSANGDFYEGQHYATGGRGSGGTADPLQSQGSLTLSRNHAFLFAVNAGSGTVSEFRVDHSSLILVDQLPSGGSEPVAVTQWGNFVYVLNSAGDGSVVPFSLGPDGHLQKMQNAISYLTGANTGGASLAISPNGQFLAVTERVPNNIDIFPIKSNGTLGTIVVNHDSDPGTFSSVFAPNGTLIVAETGPDPTSNTATLSSYTVPASGNLSPVGLNVPTLGAANCWDVVTPNGKWVYASNSASGTVSGFAIGTGGSLTPIADTVVGTNPEGSLNLDLAVSGDGKYLFTLDSGTGAISVFGIQSDGTLNNLGDVQGLPKAAGFNGIAAL